MEQNKLVKIDYRIFFSCEHQRLSKTNFEAYGEPVESLDAHHKVFDQPGFCRSYQ